MFKQHIYAREYRHQMLIVSCENMQLSTKSDTPLGDHHHQQWESPQGGGGLWLCMTERAERLTQLSCK